MSNVIPFSSRVKAQAPVAAAEERAALAAELIGLVERVREVIGHAAGLQGPSRQVEQTAQHLLDAATALERATETLTDGGEWVPF
jgi:hypothetical protein